MANTTWSTSDKTAGITLTNANLTATAPAGGGNNAVRTADRQVTGKFYWEYTFVNTGNVSCGIANANAVLSSISTTATGGLLVATVQTNGVTIVDGVQMTSIGSFSAGGIACIAVDLSARLVWFRNGAAGSWNGSASANPATGAGGWAANFVGRGFPAYGLMSASSASLAVTGNFGDTAFTGTVPSGFTSGFTSGASVPTNAVATQMGIEEWARAPTVYAQLTQIAVEEWASVTLGPYPVASDQARAMILA